MQYFFKQYYLSKQESGRGFKYLNVTAPIINNITTKNMAKKAIFLNLFLEYLAVGVSFNKLVCKSVISPDIFCIY